MAEEQKSAAGLFRLQDLQDMEVEKDELFPPSSSQTKTSGETAPAPGSMLEAIRRARAEQPVTAAPVDEPEPPPIPKALQQPELPDSGADQEGPSGGFKTDEHLALAAAMAADRQRVGRRNKVVFTLTAFVLIGGLGGALAFLLQPSPVMTEPLPIASPALVAHVSVSEDIDIEMIPEPEPEPEPVVEPEPTRTRTRTPRNRRPVVNRGDLF